MNANANWFNAMREFFNTVKAVRREFGVNTVVAHEIQHMIAIGRSQVECESVAAASRQLCNQVGF